MNLKNYIKKLFLLGLITVLCIPVYSQPTTDDRNWFYLKSEDTVAGAHHTRHAEIFGKYVKGYNYQVLKGIDVVQSHFMDGGGYFASVTAIPAESPIGYELTLLGHSLLKPPRTTSYCSGASYTAFIESLNFILQEDSQKISDERLEAIRMQESDGGRREDGIKFWGHWNDDGFGSQFALVQYSGMGTEIYPNQARPGDFINISWKKGAGHSVVFLGWYRNLKGERYMLYWASQKGTNGLGDQLVSIDRIKEIKAVRLTNPANIYKFQTDQSVNDQIPGDNISLP